MKTPLAMKLYASQQLRDCESDTLEDLSDPRIVVKKGTYDLSEDEVESLSVDPNFSSACIFELGDVTLEDAYQSLSSSDRDFVYSWIRDAAKAVHSVHVHGLLHLDIKPSNFMFFREGPLQRLKLIDFDCCRRIGSRFSSDGISFFLSLETKYLVCVLFAVWIRFRVRG